MFKLFLILGSILYLICLLVITGFSFLQFHLLWSYCFKRIKKSIVPDDIDLPKITVQIPLYNELYVAERIIDAVAAFEYPKEKLQIQVLDDSTDETVAMVARKVNFWKDQGLDIDHVRRSNRTGFKAGALKDAMSLVKGEFIAIFDADFLPKKDFLKKSVPYFKDEKIGVVQSRWDHLNEDYSLLTRLQAFQLNVHFTVEQAGRLAAGLYAQFNGTAGIWRKKTIEDAGGWKADTLTEDFDLSIRAQLNGYKIHYLEDNVAPAELPAEMNAYKSQQHRWMKGGAETARKLVPAIWKSKQLSFSQKLHTSTHLLGSSIFLFVFSLGLLSIPLGIAVTTFNIPKGWLAFFLLANILVGMSFFIGNINSSWKDKNKLTRIVRFIFFFPLFLCLSMGLSLHNSIAVIQGFLGKKSPFVRTPKFASNKPNKFTYRTSKIGWITISEFLLSISFLAIAFWGLYSGYSVFFFFHIMLFIGYGLISSYSLSHVVRK